MVGGREVEEDLKAEGIHLDRGDRPSPAFQMNRIFTEKGEDRLILIEAISEVGEEGLEEVIMIEIMEKEGGLEEEAEGFVVEVL